MIWAAACHGDGHGKVFLGSARARCPAHGGCTSKNQPVTGGTTAVPPASMLGSAAGSGRDAEIFRGSLPAARTDHQRVWCPGHDPTRVIRRVRSARSPGGLGCPSSRPCLRVRGCPRSRPMSAGWRATASEINFLTALCLQHMLCRRRAIGMVADVVTAVLERAPFPMPWRFAWARYVRGQ